MTTRALCLLVLAACGGTPSHPVDGGAVDGAVLDAGLVDAALPDAATDAALPDAASCGDAAPPPRTIDCSGTGCPELAIAGDTQDGPGSFHGFADPSLSHDPVTGTVWLAYTWPHLVAGTAPGGSPVTMAAASTHLARSDDGGASFRFVAELYPAVPTLDPEGSGQNGLVSSETPSLVAANQGGTVTWYGAHLRYFLQAMTGYHPKYGTSWVVRIGAAASPEALASAPEAVLGVATTASVWQPDTRLDALAPGLSGCALLNNPGLLAHDGTLYLAVECLGFAGSARDFAHSATHLFATTPSGPPRTWSWRYLGVLADATTAAELGTTTLIQPELVTAPDGTVLALVTPAHPDSGATGVAGDGCDVLTVTSLEPPRLARDCVGRPLVRAAAAGLHLGSCTYDAASATGLIVTSNAASWRIYSTAYRP